MTIETNKRLRNEIKELKDLVSALLSGWKAKHPQDFVPPSNLKLMNGQETSSNSNAKLDEPSPDIKEGCGKENSYGYAPQFCGDETGWLCDECKEKE